MKNREAYLIRTVINDLRFLKDEWHQNIELESVIRSSNVLRLLLADSNLQKAWQLCGYTFPIRLRALTLNNVLNTYNREQIIIAFAGGGMHYKIKWALGVLLRSEDRGHEKIQSNQKPPTSIELTLDKYLQVSCMLIGEQDINRVELIKYAANKLGGTHIDFTRKANKPLEQKFMYLDSLHEFKDVHKNIIPYQLLSIGQELVNSRHIQRLIKRQV